MKELLKKYKSHIILSIIAVIFLFVGYEYYYKYSKILKNSAGIKDYIMSYGKYGILVFLMMQIIQVVVFFIPGELIQIAGGYIYGTFWGTLLSLAGISIGSIIDYFISSRYGKPFVKKLVSKKHIWILNKLTGEEDDDDEYKARMNILIFTLYLIPGIPKDILGYICGISSISFKEFLMLSTLGRTPGIIVSSFFGAKISKDNVLLLVIIAASMAALFLFGVLKGKNIASYITKKKDKRKNGVG